MGRGSRKVIIKVVQRHHGGPFLRLVGDPRIPILEISAPDMEARASFCIHKISCLVEQFFEGLIELLRCRVALLSNSF